MENKNDIEMLIHIARLYYEASMSQEEIASAINVSRPTISRMLNKAKQKGYIRTVVIDPFDSIHSMKSELKESFLLKDVIIVQSLGVDSRVVKQRVGSAAAEYLTHIIKPNDIVGVAWGTTIYEIAKALPQSELSSTTVVQLGGILYNNKSDNYVFDVVHSFGTKLNSKVYYLYTPAIVPSVKIKQAFLFDNNIKRILDMGRKSNIALFGLGMPEKTSLIMQNGYISSDEFEKLYEANVVGDICSRFFDINGRIVNNDLNSRTIGISLEDFINKEYAICAVSGKSRASGIYAALRAGYINVLITDEITAKEVLRIKDNR